MTPKDTIDPFDPHLMLTRRRLLGHGGIGLGSVALSGLLGAGAGATAGRADGAALLSHHVARARRVIYLFMAGAPSQMDLFDYKPELDRLHGSELPDSVRGGQRLTGMTANQDKLRVARHIAPFSRRGANGTWLSDLLPYHGGIIDDLALVKTVYTEAINHDPAITFFQTGNQQPGRPSLGSWVSYGIGSENRDLPAFVVLLSRNVYAQAQPLYDRLWGSGFLPGQHQGVRLRSGDQPVHYLLDPSGARPGDQRPMLDGLARLNARQHELVGDPDIQARIAAYEMAYRMQMSVPDLSDLSQEPDSTFEMYGEESRVPGTFAANCLLARRLAERDVRFIQIYQRGWDHHSHIETHHPTLCRMVDQPAAALIKDLKARGLLDDTLVIFGGEFGRTVYAQGNPDRDNYGRDHHPRCFSMWLAGAGVQAGRSFGETDEFCYNIVEGGVHVHELNATILHLLGIDHQRLSHRFQGLDQRLTGVEPVRPALHLLA